MKKAYKFRIYPNKNQEVKLNRTLFMCRHLYNDALKERKRQAELNRLCSEFSVFPWGKPEWISYEYQANDLTQSKTLEQKEVFSQVLQDTLRRLDKAFKSFYRGFGYPRFRGWNRYDSFTYPKERFALEPRNLSFFEKDVLKNIEQMGMTFVSVDAPDLPRNIYATADAVYLRMHGRENWYSYCYSEEELKEIVEKIGELKAESAYIFFNNDHDMLENTRVFRRLSG